MTKAEWEKEHHYTRWEHYCGLCKHAVHKPLAFIRSYICKEREKDGVSKSVESEFSCDLWEHE
jgi:hypothetical protein